MAVAEEDPLGAQVRALFMDLAHAGDLDGAGVCRGEAGRVAEGTQVRFSLRLSGTRVEQVRYRAYGCPFTLATCEWLARQLTGCQLSELSAPAISMAVGTPPEWAAALGIPSQRLGRLLVVEDALRQAAGRRSGS
ncbi:MAG TPA: iron-sulfur cluster assembly scaffold protein [Steroidobacteraceae bacterium]|nr:iron-sulfur cluster assembly scaffold protein [Steroidobacteraceae bacterium]